MCMYDCNLQNPEPVVMTQQPFLFLSIVFNVN